MPKIFECDLCKTRIESARFLTRNCYDENPNKLGMAEPKWEVSSGKDLYVRDSICLKCANEIANAIEFEKQSRPKP